MSAYWKKKKKKKGGHFLTQKVSAFVEIGVFFSLKIREKGSFFKSGNTDMSSLSEASAGTGTLPLRAAHMRPAYFIISDILVSILFHLGRAVWVGP